MFQMWEIGGGRVLISTGTMIYLAVLAIMDARRREISAVVLVLGSFAAVGMAGWLLLCGSTSWELLLFGAVPGLLLLALAGMTGGAGVGDGIVLLQLSFLLLLDRVVIAFGVSMLVMGAFSAVILLTKQGKKDLRLPYLPFLWLGCLVAICICGGEGI